MGPEQLLKKDNNKHKNFILENNKKKKCWKATKLFILNKMFIYFPCNNLKMIHFYFLAYYPYFQEFNRLEILRFLSRLQYKLKCLIFDLSSGLFLRLLLLMLQGCGARLA